MGCGNSQEAGNTESTSPPPAAKAAPAAVEEVKKEEVVEIDVVQVTKEEVVEKKEEVVEKKEEVVEKKEEVVEVTKEEVVEKKEEVVEVEKEEVVEKKEEVVEEKKEEAVVEEEKKEEAVVAEEAVEIKGSENYEKFKACFESISIRENKAERKKSWGSCDGNGSGKISLAEYDGWVKSELNTKYGPDGEAIWDAFRPSYIRAFSDANDVAPGDDDFITFREFRVSVVYLLIYGNLFDAFSSLDGGSSGITGGDDDRVSLEEFKTCASALCATPCVAFTKENLIGKEEEVFAKINESGDKILFKEFCKYVEKTEKEAGTKWGELLTMGDDEGEE